MNLLSLLLGSMMTQSSVNNLSGKTGTSQSAIMRLLPLAIPILIKYLTVSDKECAEPAGRFISARCSYTAQEHELDGASAC